MTCLYLWWQSDFLHIGQQFYGLFTLFCSCECPVKLPEEGLIEGLTMSLISWPYQCVHDMWFRANWSVAAGYTCKSSPVSLVLYSPIYFFLDSLTLALWWWRVWTRSMLKSSHKHAACVGSQSWINWRVLSARWGDLKLPPKICELVRLHSLQPLQGTAH